MARGASISARAKASGLAQGHVAGGSVVVRHVALRLPPPLLGGFTRLRLEPILLLRLGVDGAYPVPLLRRLPMKLALGMQPSRALRLKPRSLAPRRTLPATSSSITCHLVDLCINVRQCARGALGGFGQRAGGDERLRLREQLHGHGGPCSRLMR
eukprot:SAG11_NODE_1808_length_4225_cov_4.052338_1_plen_155_part_00